MTKVTKQARLGGRKLANLLAAMSMAMTFPTLAADYYWSGALGDYDGSQPGNWLDENGTVMTVAPGVNDTLIITNNVENNIKYHIATTGNNTTFKKIVLAGDGNAYLELGNGANPTVTFPVDGIFNYTESGALTIGKSPLQMLKGSESLRVTNLVHVAHENATVKNDHHMQSGNAYSDVVKTGYGTFIPWTSNSYGTQRRHVVVQGTYKFITNTKSMETDYLVFSGDDPTATFRFVNGKTFGFIKPILEEGVTTTDHTMTSDSNANNTLALTGTVTSATFTGRLRGKLSFDWSPDNGDQTFTFSRGESDSTGRLKASNGTISVINGARFTSLSAVQLVNGGRLSLDSGASVTATSLSVDDATSARVTIASGTVLYANNVTVGGASIGVGIYTGGDYPWLAGDGLLIVRGSSGADLSVPYDAATCTATPVDMTGASLSAGSLELLPPLTVKLSEQITIPFYETNRIAVAHFAASVGVAPADFTDASAKTCDLPRTWFETETADGVTTLYLVARPVVVALGQEGDGQESAHYFMRDAAFWSDAKLPHAGADYYSAIDTLDSQYNYDYANVTSDDNVFPGESLTFNRSRYGAYSNGFRVDDLRIYNANKDMNTMVVCSKQSGTTLSGKIYVDASCTGLEFRPLATATAFKIASDITCKAAKVTFRYLWTASPLGRIELLGDNRGIEGRTVISGGINSSKETWNDFTLGITNAIALGGPMSALSVNGLRFDYFPRLDVMDTTTYDTLNRHVSAIEGFRLRVADGKTFTLLNPYRCSISYTENVNTYCPGRCAIEKTGGGLFALGARVIPSNSSMVETAADGTNNLVRVKEGGVMAVTADAFDNLALEFSDGTAIVADPSNAATAAQGLRLVDVAPAFESGAKVALRPVDGYVPAEGAVTVAYLTVPAATPDLTGHLTVPNIHDSAGRKWHPTLSSATSDGLTTYSVSYRQLGFMILFR